MKIRFTDERDIDALIVLARQMHGESRLKEHQLGEARVRKSFMAMYKDPINNCVLVAESESGGIIGVLAGSLSVYLFADVRVAQDKWFYVLPSYIGGSTALKLMVTFRRWAMSRQAQEICINSSADLDQVRFSRFMNHLGFTVTGSNFVLGIPAINPIDSNSSADSTPSIAPTSVAIH